MEKFQFTVKGVDDKQAKKIIGAWREKVKRGQIRFFSYRRLPSRYPDLFDLLMTVEQK